MNERARGALLGLAVGDALGTTYEFERIDQPAYPILATRPATDVVGGGPFDLAPGAVTDDTQLAVCLARSLRDRGGLDVDDVAARYVAWMDGAFDIGNQTRGALDRIERGESAHSAGKDTWRASQHHAAGNGSLMRTAPLGVALAGAPLQVLLDAALAESMITHADPRCALACAAFDAAIAHAIRGGDDMLGAARAALAAATLRLANAWAKEDPVERELVAHGRIALEADLDAAAAAQPDVYGTGLHLHKTAGFVRVAFRLAFWHLVHTPSWHDALVDVASRGGDADTNSAIVGALLGARDGVAAIPPPWVARVLAAKQGGPADWGERHHPRHLLTLVE